ncbi:MAG TPA: glycosyltransferase family 4 protein [Terriglobales bacterium]|nr:glycosyltransferase family 4 protein [Terriglobales bacterium]
MRILYISHLYPPEVAAAAARVSELSQRWVTAGHDVTVLTGYPNHPNGKVPPNYSRGHWWRVRREWQHGVRVVRAPLLPAANRGTVRRSVAFMSSALSTGLIAPLLKRSDIVIATSPQPLNLLPGLLTQALRHTPLVFELRDLWPEQLGGVGYSMDSAMVRLMRQWVACGYRHARHIVTVSPAYGPILTAQYGVPPEKISLVPNGVDTAMFRPGVQPLREQFGLLPDHFVVGFVGTLGLSQRFDPIFAAAEVLRDRSPSVRFLIIGDGANRAHLESQIQQRGLRNIQVFGLQPRAMMPGILAGLNVALVSLDDNPYFRVALPSKMFELMAMEIPILLMAQGVSADLLAQARAGLVVQDQLSLTDAILRCRHEIDWARSLGAQGREFVRAQFDRDHLALRYLDILRAITGHPAGQTKAARAGVA